ncbi:LADA_0G00650g1_1 [Lachancea dasiensis]|uniref:LADA_0G00650g1_1 n=1 Tax=Lachancea dasiensis TaxID=1072105 RepID=A0A1G4JQB3_9SACH|nr:LADA_0G00650g1_1 [Lachancea dasiensis]
MGLGLSTEGCDTLKTWLSHEFIRQDPGTSAQCADFILDVLDSLPSIDHIQYDTDTIQRVESHLAGIVDDPTVLVGKLPSKLKEIKHIEEKQQELKPSKSVIICNTPIRYLDEKAIKGTFKPFGSIQSCKINLQHRQVVIEYQNESCAIRCTKAATVFFGNRFVTVNLFHDSLENFDGSTLFEILNPNKPIEDSIRLGKSNDSAPEENNINKDVRKVQNMPQALFENNQNPSEALETNLDDLLDSREELLKVHQTTLRKLLRKTEELNETEEGNNLESITSELLELERSMQKLGIKHDTMLELKLRKMNRDHPGELTIEDGAAKKKRARKLNVLRRKLKRRR